MAKRPNNSENSEESSSSSHGENPIIVGIGASAGGVQTLESFFATLPANTGAAFVVIVHLHPQYQSDLARILAARTAMPVVQVEKTDTLQADHVYVIPPDRRLLLSDSRVAATAFEEPHGQRAPIDLFFRSLGEHGEGFAVILTGSGSDGALGVRAVKETAGIILVQDPDEADYPSMPRAAIATGLADFVLPLKDLALRLAELISAKKKGTTADREDIDEEQLRRVLAHLHVRTGHDFTKYKRSTVLRQLSRRMQVTRTESLAEYYEVLRDKPDEVQALLGDLLISVTTFFRDEQPFNALKTQVIPELFVGKTPADQIRVWVAGCATGEEAYSIAILLLEEAAGHDLRPSIQIFATDMDTRALAFAREGRYPAAIETDVSEERVQRFFMRENEGYRLSQTVRDIVLFAAHDVLKDPPFSRVDLICCRNLLIYLNRELQEQVCSTFHYALDPGGYLFLGTSETADNPSGLFQLIDRTSRIYQSTARPGDKPRLLPRLLGGVGLYDHVAQAGRAPTPSDILNEAALHRRVVERLAPPSILVDEAHRAVHLSENAGRFLQPSGGPMNSNVVDLVRPELRFELRSALLRAFEQHQSTLSLPILVSFNGTAHRVHIQVKPAVDDQGGAPRHAIVMFIEGEAVDEKLLAEGQEQPDSETVHRLKQELELTQNHLRTVREESDTANEELRASNEELQSINEEYRSTSEELETSKEELQSINEELQTVNNELKLKLDTISRAHSDLQNLMAATDIGTLFLDAQLRVKRFTDRVTDLFSLTPADEGRPITDFAHQLEYEDLIKDAHAVLAKLTPISQEVRSRDEHWYDMRLRPYRTVDNKIDGVVITFVDITGRRQTEDALRAGEHSLKQYKQLIALAHEPIFTWDLDGGIVEWNRGCEELYGFRAAEAIGKASRQLLGTVVSDSSFEALKEALRRDHYWSGKLQQKTKDGRVLTVESHIQFEPLDGKRLVLESIGEVIEQKK